MKIRLFVIGAISLVTLVAGGCGREGGGAAGRAGQMVIAISGSDTMVNLAQMWAEEYRKVRPEVSVEVSGGGSGVGLRDLTAGVVDAANCSRDISGSEKEQIQRQTGREPREFLVAYDGIVLYVHKDNPLDTITIAQLAEIFGEGGRIERWSQLGVKMRSDEIVRVSRQNNSGTYKYFQEHVLGGRDFKLGSRDMSGSKDVVELVARTPGALGYSGMGYATPAVKMLKIAKVEGGPAVAPTVESVRDQSYPLARAMYMLTAGAPKAYVEAYIEWILSPAGQRVVEAMGYVPVSH